MPYTENAHKTFVAAGPVSKGKLVAFGPDGLTSCNATGKPVGVAESTVVSGEPVTVRLFNAGGTVEVVAGGTFAVGDAVAPKADGSCVKQAGDAVPFGVALGAGASGAIVEILPY